MTPVFQRVVHPEHGDCHRAAVASILDLALVRILPNLHCLGALMHPDAAAVIRLPVPSSAATSLTQFALDNFAANFGPPDPPATRAQRRARRSR